MPLPFARQQTATRRATFVLASIKGAPRSNVGEYPQSHRVMPQVPRAIDLRVISDGIAKADRKRDGQEQPKRTNHGPLHAYKGLPGQSPHVQSERETADTELCPRPSSSASARPALGVRETRYKQSCPLDWVLVIPTSRGAVPQPLRQRRPGCGRRPEANLNPRIPA